MSVFAARYARAFAGVVFDGKLDPVQIQTQIDDFAGTFSGSPDLQQYLLNPSIPAAKRIQALDAVNARVGCSRPVRNFVAVLIRHERLGALDEILDEYRAEMDRRLNIAEAEVTTARPLAERERAELEERVAKMAGSRIRATFREDQSLIGGAIVQVGSTIYDGSVRGRLERLKEQLAAG